MLGHRLLRGIVVACITLTAWLSSNSAFADTAPSNAELFALIKSLQARVSALEVTSAEYKKEAETARATINQMASSAEPRASAFQPLLLATPTNGHSVAEPRVIMASTNPSAVPQWSGLYWGTSFGGGFTQSKVKSRETYMANFPTNSFPEQTDTFSSVAKSSGHDTGAALDLFAGVNQQIGRRLVGGVQVEGSIADLNFDSDGTRSFVESNDAGPTGYTGKGPFRPHVHARWMVSALARAGFLVSPTTLTYGLVGWTGAQFEYQNLTDNLFYQPEDSFWSNGITVGGGVEQKLDKNWSLRAEYRFTDFANVSVGNNFAWSSNPPSTQTNTIRTKFDENLQMVRLGVSYLFQ